jgi:hypothetical protein
VDMRNDRRRKIIAVIRRGDARCGKTAQQASYCVRDVAPKSRTEHLTLPDFSFPPGHSAWYTIGTRKNGPLGL